MNPPPPPPLRPFSVKLQERRAPVEDGGPMGKSQNKYRHEKKNGIAEGQDGAPSWLKGRAESRKIVVRHEFVQRF